MELSYFLAQIIGLTITIVALGALLKPRAILSALSDFNSNSFLTLITGFMTLVIGISLVLSHNIWDGSWRVIITIVGWGSLIKGILYIFAPTALLSYSRLIVGSQSRMKMSFLLMLIIGGYLTFKGFGN